MLALLLLGRRALAMDQTECVRVARQYLASEDRAERRSLAARLDAYDGDFAPVIAELATGSFDRVKPGYHPARRFSLPQLRTRHPDDLLYFTVPETYRRDRPTGLIVFLHGGGRTTSRRAPAYFMDFPDEGEEGEDSELGDLFSATGMIAVGPSAPWDEESAYRWCLEESDQYLADVIEECKARFNINPDRVILVGHSMGGFGAYHHIQRQPDRFAAVVVNSGSWSLAYLPMFRGTPLCIVQGVHDARDGQRWHYTDVEYARWTDRLLSRKRIDYTYFEHDGEHAVSEGREYIARFLKSAGRLRRDPYYPHVVLASPVGFKRSYCFAAEHNRWLTLDEATDGELEYDELITNGEEDFDRWRLRHRTVQRPGAAIHAVNKGDNVIDVTVKNVARFTIWLHPQMIDLDQSVTILVNGKQQFKQKVEPSLLTALQSYERRRDWGLIYPMKIPLEIDSDE